MNAIVAMSRNRVIGNCGELPWRIPEDFRWFKKVTFNGVIIMGRKTFEGLRKPLVGRVNIVLTRHPARLRQSTNPWLAGAAFGRAAHTLRGVLQPSLPQIPQTEVRLARGMESLKRAGVTAKAWLCGGAQVYEQFLPECSELYLSLIDRDVQGDATFPKFEHLFDLSEVLVECPDFRVLRYVRNNVASEVPGVRPRSRAQGLCVPHP